MNYQSILTSKAFQLGVAIGVSGTLGAAGGYAFAKKRIGAQAREIIDQEILETKRFYANLNDTRKAEKSPADLVASNPYKDAARTMYESGMTAINEYGTGIIPQSILDRKAGESSILTTTVQGEGDHDETEIEIPEDATVPYLISTGVFVQNEHQHDQVTVTWYEGDDVLADTDDTPIPLTHIGGNIQNFGRGTGDPKVMYIRNETLGVDFEVIQHQGHFAEVVLGLEVEEKPTPAYRKPKAKPRGRELGSDV